MAFPLMPKDIKRVPDKVAIMAPIRSKAAAIFALLSGVFINIMEPITSGRMRKVYVSATTSFYGYKVILAVKDSQDSNTT
eukprot:2747793-Ditylum_brightwellii.AAC.1